MTWGILHDWSKIELVQPMAHQTLSSAQAGALRELATLGFLNACPLKFIGLSGAPSNYLVRQRATVNFAQQSSVILRAQSTMPKVRRQSTTTGLTGLCGVPPDCPVQQKDKRFQRSTAPNPNGQLTWHAPDSEQYCVQCTIGLSSVPIDRADNQRLE